jgi:hypothetical protein
MADTQCLRCRHSCIALQTLTLNHMVANHTRRNLVHDMMAGGERRERWAEEEGARALEAIQSQRAITEIVSHHRHNLKAGTFGTHGASAARQLKRLPTATLSRFDWESGATHGSPDEAIMRLAAAEADKGGRSHRAYRLRRRKFRKVRGAGTWSRAPG